MNTHLAKLRGQPTCLPRSSGFTLVEVMVTVSLAALLVGLAAPAFVDVNRKFRINSVSTAVASGLQTARFEAIKANAGVIMCARDVTGTDCTESTNWGANGWIVCYDLDANRQCDPSSATRQNPIRVQAALDPGIATINGPSTGVRFDALGARPLAAGTVSVTVAGTWSNAPSLATSVAATGLIKGSRL